MSPDPSDAIGGVSPDPTAPVLARARTYFGSFAAEYDTSAAEVGWVPNQLLAEALTRMGPVRDALDLACGTGATLAVMRRCRPDAALTGVDLCAPMLDRARAAVPDVRYVLADVAAHVACAAAAGDRFDLVTAIGCLEFTDDAPAVLTDARRLVRPGGHLIVTYEPVIVGWEPQELRAETNLGSNGLELTTFRWEPGEVTAGFDGWHTVRDRLVVAYQRDELPTLYGWLHCRRDS